MELGLSGKAVLITGASRGIGAATARAFAAEDVGELHLVARTADDVERLARELRSSWSVDVHAHCRDVGLAEDRQRLYDDAPHIDIVVNNAGAIPPGPLAGADLVSWRESWELKVWGYIELVQHYADRMSEHGGVIVNNIGVAGDRPDPQYVAGSAANAALMALTKSVGSTSLDQGVRIVGVNPGLVETDRIRSIFGRRTADVDESGATWKALLQERPAGRLAQPEEIAAAIVFLASARSGYTSGCVLTVDGGFSSRGQTF